MLALSNPNKRRIDTVTQLIIDCNIVRRDVFKSMVRDKVIFKPKSQSTYALLLECDVINGQA